MWHSEKEIAEFLRQKEETYSALDLDAFWCKLAFDHQVIDDILDTIADLHNL